ncbi:MAG: NRDE family protein [Ignavibacteria bacterium]|nr:NRDE family protein [Ignavibacteria bacterium]MDP3831494.1 NRDE family protein [Ignavibacteriaceae bacterium]
MCLILIAHNVHPDYKLIVAANRDEFYNRPTQPAQYWEKFPTLLAGKDLSAGGTWLGITKHGKFCAITNFRDLRNLKQEAPSRGDLVLSYLTSEINAFAFINKLQTTGYNYNGFNLLFGNVDSLTYYSNQNNESAVLTPGIYGLSNHFLDTPWFKNTRSKQMFESIISKSIISENDLITLLQDRIEAPEEQLPDTGIGKEWEKVLSPIFIHSETYGTRCSTIITVSQQNEVKFIEVSYNNFGEESEHKSYEFIIKD